MEILGGTENEKKRLIFSLSILVGLSLFFLANLSLENKDHKDKEYSNVYRVKADQTNEDNEKNGSLAIAIVEADHFFMDDINDLEEVSTLVVKAKYTGNRTLKEWTDIPTGEVIVKGSESKVKVSGILQGEINSNSPIITIYEPAYFEDDIFVSIVKSIRTYKDIENVEYFGENVEGFNKLKTQVLKNIKNNQKATTYSNGLFKYRQNIYNWLSCCEGSWEYILSFYFEVLY